MPSINETMHIIMCDLDSQYSGTITSTDTYKENFLELAEAAGATPVQSENFWYEYGV